MLGVNYPCGMWFAACAHFRERCPPQDAVPSEQQSAPDKGIPAASCKHLATTDRPVRKSLLSGTGQHCQQSPLLSPKPPHPVNIMGGWEPLCLHKRSLGSLVSLPSSQCPALSRVFSLCSSSLKPLQMPRELCNSDARLCLARDTSPLQPALPNCLAVFHAFLHDKALMGTANLLLLSSKVLGVTYSFELLRLGAHA